MEGVTFDQVDAIIDKSHFEKKVAKNLHGNFAIKQCFHGQKLYFLCKCLLFVS